MATTNVKYSKSDLMKYAWFIFKAGNNRTMETWSECLKKAWHIAKTNPRGLQENVLTFNKVYEKYYDKVFNYVRFKIKNDYIAEEITSETFVKVSQSFNDYDKAKGAISTWIYTIANNNISSYFRSDKSKYNVNVSDFVDENGKEKFEIAADCKTDTKVENKELLATIQKAFANLKPKYQRMAQLYFMEQKKYEEIAEICGIPIGSVKGMLSRCREMLQQQLINTRAEYYE